MMELQIYKPTEDQFIRAIEFNFNELKEQLTQALEKYRDVVFTDEQMTQAKKQRADLNRFKGAIDARRIDIKKQLLDPYNDFEAKIKELTGMVDDVAAGIDAQVKAWEEQLREKKRAGIVEIYNDIVPVDFQGIMPLDKIFDQKWLNATASTKAIAAAIQNRYNSCQEDLDVIRELDNPYENQIIAFYLQTLDLGKAIAEGKRLEAEMARMREYEEKQALAAANRDPIPAAQQQAQPAQTLFEQGQTAPSAPGPPPSLPQLIEISFRMWVTEAQREELKTWIRKNQIRVAKV